MTAQKTVITPTRTICLYLWYDHTTKKIEVGPASPWAQRKLESSEALRTHYMQAGTRVFSAHRNEGIVIVDPGTPVPHGALTLERLCRELETALMNPMFGDGCEWSVTRRPEP